MIFGGITFAGAPYAGNIATDYQNNCVLNLLFLSSLLFFGDIGEVTPIPPDLNVPPTNLFYRRSPCLLYEPS